MGNLKSIAVNGRSYDVCGKLGSGGFSEVYLVQDRRTKLRMALKVMECQEDEQLQRALMEVQLHRRIDHPNVLRLLGSEIRLKAQSQRNSMEHSLTRSKEVLMLFPALTRGSLQDILNHASLHKEPALSEGDCLELFRGIVHGVREIHRLGLAHRDIKPANILLSDEFTPIVMDLGSVAPLSRIIQTHQEAMEMIEGAAQFSSGAYRAPELYDDCFRGELNGATDVWSLGCTLYAMAFGPFSPFESSIEGVKVLSIRNGVVRFPANPAYSSAFCQLIRGMLQVNPKDRPSLDTLLQAAQALLHPTQAISQTEDAMDWADFSTVQHKPPLLMTKRLHAFKSAENFREPAKATINRRSLSDRHQLLAERGRSMLQLALSDDN